MIRENKIRLLAGSLLILLTGCFEEVINQQNFVIEAFLYAGEPVRDVRVKEIADLEGTDTTEVPIQDAIVTLTEGSNSYSLEYNMGTGKYEYNGNDLEIRTGDEFNLSVIVNEREATGQTIVPSRPENVNLSDNKVIIPTLVLSLGLRDQIFELFNEARISVNWKNTDEESFYVAIDKRVQDIDPILPELIPDDARELITSFRFISEPSQDSSFDIVGVSLETYGLHVAKVYRVNPEYEDLFNNLEQDSRDLNEPPSNIVNALGIFTAFAGDSVFFEVQRE